jgi:DNA end-binding protein Ku
MAPRPAWKGYLKLSLVTCAVELSAATSESDKISFHILNRATGNRVRRQYVHAETGKPVEEDDQVNGYEIGDGEFLLVEEEEIDAVQIESSHTLALETFVKSSEVEQIYLDKPYYLAPADKVSEEAFAVIRDALEKKRMAGLARIVLYRRERPVLIEPFGKGMLLTTLRYDRIVRRPETVFEETKEGEVDEKAVELAVAVVEKRKRKFDPSGLEDHYQEALQDFVKSKKAGRKPADRKAKAPESKPSNVVNLFDALKKSLGEEKGAAKTPRSGTAAKRASPKNAKRASPRKKTVPSRKRKSA